MVVNHPHQGQETHDQDRADVGTRLLLGGSSELQDADRDACDAIEARLILLVGHLRPLLCLIPARLASLTAWLLGRPVSPSASTSSADGRRRRRPELLAGRRAMAAQS